MLRFLDPGFRHVAALIDDTGCSAKVREAARQHAEMVAIQCGFTLAEALRHAGVKLRPIPPTLPNVAEPRPADDPVEAEECSSLQHLPSNSEAEVLDNDSVGIADVTSGPGDCSDSAGAELEPPAPHVVKCHHGNDDSDDAAPGGQIQRALKADPSRSDRDVAREFDVSPTTVGRMRKALGLGKTVRSVVRRCVAYQMQTGDRS